MRHDQLGDYPEHAQWALKRWGEAVGDFPNEREAWALVKILEQHREILAGQVRGIKVGEVFKNQNGIRERDIAAERMARTYVSTCAAMVQGRFGMVPQQKPRFKGRDVDDVLLPEQTNL